MMSNPHPPPQNSFATLTQPPPIPYVLPPGSGPLGGGYDYIPPAQSQSQRSSHHSAGNGSSSTHHQQQHQQYSNNGSQHSQNQSQSQSYPPPGSGPPSNYPLLPHQRPSVLTTQAEFEANKLHGHANMFSTPPSSLATGSHGPGIVIPNPNSAGGWGSGGGAGEGGLSSAGVSVSYGGRSAIATPSTSLPFPPNVEPRPLTTREGQLVDHLVRLQLFLATAPSAWQQFGTIPSGMIPEGSTGSPWQPTMPGHPTTPRPTAGAAGGTTGSGAPGGAADSFVSCPHPALNRFLLPNGEYVTCVYWNGLYQITGTDIVRALAFRFEAFGRPVKLSMVKKFEEGVFSDLRNLKPGEDSSLEKPKSDFLDLLFKYGCIRTQKKQKVFFWFSVPHDRLFLDALERDLKREKDGQQPTTEIIGEPARSFRWDPNMSLYEQFAESTSQAQQEQVAEEGPLDPALEESKHSDAASQAPPPAAAFAPPQQMPIANELAALVPASEGLPQLPPPTGAEHRSNPFTVSLFEGSPGYKQRRKKSRRAGDDRGTGSDDGWSGSEDESDRDRGVVAAVAATEVQPEAAAYPVENVDAYGGSGFGGPSVPHPGGLGTNYAPPPPQAAPPSDYGAYPTQSKEEPFGDDMAQVYPTHGHRDVSSDWGTPVMQQSSLAPYPYQSGSGGGGGGSQPMAYQSSSSPYQSVSISRHTHSQSPMPNIPIDASSTAVETTQPGNGALAGRMFRCPLETCSRLFKRLEHLKRHVRTHTQERPYVCQRCHKRFSRSDNLTQHLKTHEKADRGERSMSTAGISDAEMEYSRLMGMSGDDLSVMLPPGHPHLMHGRDGYPGSSPFGDEGSLYGSPAPPNIQRYGSVPPGFQPQRGYDHGRFSMPPPTITGSPHSDRHSVRLRSGSFSHGIQPGLDGADSSPYMGNRALGSRSPMPTVPHRALSMQAGGGAGGGGMRSVSQPGASQRFAPYPSSSRMPPPPGPSYSPDPAYPRQSYSASMPLVGQNSLLVPSSSQSFAGSPLPETSLTQSPMMHPAGIPNGNQTLGQSYSLQPPSQHGDDGSHIPLQSPASFGFENMVATASYSTGEQAAAGWPAQQEGEDGMAAGAAS